MQSPQSDLTPWTLTLVFCYFLPKDTIVGFLTFIFQKFVMKKVLNAFWTELRHFGYSARLSERGWLDSPTLISWKINFQTAARLRWLLLRRTSPHILGAQSSSYTYLDSGFILI